MNLKEFGSALAQIGLPLLGAALPLPGGMALGSALADFIGKPGASLADVATHLGESAEARQKAQEFQATHQETMLRLTVEAERDRFAAMVADRQSARKASVEGGTAKPLLWLSILLLIITLGTEVSVLFVGYPVGLHDIIIGRILGLMDAVAMMVLSFWYGTTSASERKTELLAASPAIPK